MRTKKAEIASQKQIGDTEPITIDAEPIAIPVPIAISVDGISDGVIEAENIHKVEDVPKAKEYRVFVRFLSRENAENFKFKLKSLGYDNAELREV